MCSPLSPVQKPSRQEEAGRRRRNAAGGANRAVRGDGRVILTVGDALGVEVVGKIQKIDMDQKMLVLEDGTQLWLAEGKETDKLKEGAKVKLSYEERDGKKWITGVEVVAD